MALLPELDKRKTRENVRQFFEDEFPRLQQQAHISFVDVKSPIISGMPGGGHDGNATDIKLSIHTQAKVYVHVVLDAFAGMTQPYRHFMELRYFNNLTWDQVCERTGYSTRRGQEIISEAFLMFAEGFADTYDFRVML